MSEQGKKYDGGKLRYDLIPVLALEETAKVVTKGAEKYDDENWKLVPEGRRRYLAAAIRHIQQWRKGEIYDEEMGTHHIANAISNLMFILEKDLRGWEDVGENKPVANSNEEDQWIKWESGCIPVDSNKLVSVRFRDGTVLSDEHAGFWSWTWIDGKRSSEIVAYRVID